MGRGRCALDFNYQGERLKENVEELVAEFGENVPLFPAMFQATTRSKIFRKRARNDRVDLMLHSLAYARARRWKAISLAQRRSFRVAHDVSGIR